MKIAPPAPTVTSIRFDTGDILVVKRSNVIGGAKNQLVATFLRDDGQIVNIQESLPALSAQSTGENNYVMTGGYLLTLTITADSFVRATDMFVTVMRNRGSVNTYSNRLTFLSGYPVYPSGLSYPGSGLEPVTTAPWEMTVDQATQAGTGNPCIYTWSNFAYSNLENAFGEFQASGAAANRTLRAILQDSNGFVFDVYGRTVITAGQTRNFQLWKGSSIPADNTTTHYIPIPEQSQGNLLDLTITALNIDANDAFNGVFVRFKQRPGTASV